jgi:hypothetical protein
MKFIEQFSSALVADNSAETSVKPAAQDQRSHEGS